MRGLLAEYGIVVAKGIRQLRQQLTLILEDGENELSVQGREFIAQLYEELCELDEKIKGYDKKLHVIFNAHPVCKKLSQIEGLGVINSTAVIAAVGDPSVFKNGRHMSAWLGLTPRQHSSGNKTALLGISKRGDCYLRKLLVHGARSVVHHAQHRTDRRSQWIAGIVQRGGKNKAAVALANKNVRIIWAMLKQGTDYRKAA